MISGRRADDIAPGNFHVARSVRRAGEDGLVRPGRVVHVHGDGFICFKARRFDGQRVSGINGIGNVYAIRFLKKELNKDSKQYKKIKENKIKV